jgi:5-methyltetrahydrofolate--homocysteine methyltransferase
MSELIEKIRLNVLQGRVDQEDEGADGDMEGEPGVTELVKEAVAAGIPPKTILLEGLTKGMDEVGKLYEDGDYLIPDMLAAAESVGVAMDILEPVLKRDGVESKGRFIIATVEGDLHDIGKNIVATMLRGAGYEVKDLGVGVKADRIIEAVWEHKAPYLGLSALLTTTMPQMKIIVDALQEKNLRDGTKVFIGGAPTSREFTESIGADVYCRDAFEAIEALRTMEGQRAS